MDKYTLLQTIDDARRGIIDPESIRAALLFLAYHPDAHTTLAAARIVLRGGAPRRGSLRRTRRALRRFFGLVDDEAITTIIAARHMGPERRAEARKHIRDAVTFYRATSEHRGIGGAR